MVARTAIAPLPKDPEANERSPKLARAGHHQQQETVETALPNLDRVIHERMRLGIVSALAVNESLTFNELKKLLQTTDGNLSVHARRLEEAEYIGCTKTFEGRMPKTEYRLTESGRKAFERYLNHMEALIQAMRER
jgi:DNA-binding HxlR family transcriptional regulator